MKTSFMVVENVDIIFFSVLQVLKLRITSRQVCLLDSIPPAGFFIVRKKSLVVLTIEEVATAAFFPLPLQFLKPDN